MLTSFWLCLIACKGNCLSRAPSRTTALQIASRRTYHGACVRSNSVVDDGTGGVEISETGRPNKLPEGFSCPTPGTYRCIGCVGRGANFQSCVRVTCRTLISAKARLVAAPGTHAECIGINSRGGARLYSFSFFPLYTYLVPNPPAQESGDSVGEACIAHRGVVPHSIVLRGHGGRNFCSCFHCERRSERRNEEDFLPMRCVLTGCLCSCRVGLSVSD